jgi:histidyl-tRNA synthetase
VYRGERAQKGRYREFYQCDIDAIGKDSLPLSYDAEVAAVIHELLVQLKVGDFTIRVNNRKLLKGVLDARGIAAELQAPVLHEIDRLDKMKREEVVERLAKVGLSAEAAGGLLDLLTAKESSAATLAGLEARFAANEGFVELKQVYESMIALGVSEQRVRVSPSTVRGLDYYTGTVYETFLDGAPGLGSICSGGRYENLAGYYTKSKLPGVGISIGLTRLFEQLLELKALPTTPGTAKVLVVNADPTLRNDYFTLAKELRAKGINTEVYGPKKDVGKQYDYAQRCGVPLAVVMNAQDKEKGTVLIKRVTVAQDSADKQRIVAKDSLVATVLEMLHA